MSKPLNLCEYCQKTLNEAKDWEVNLKKEVKEKCQGEKNCNLSTFGHNGYYHSGFPHITIVSCQKCQKDQKRITNSGRGDKLEEKISACQCHSEKPNQENKELEKIKQYFTKNNIKSIKLENDQLVIEYNNSQMETKAVNTNELQVIKNYCQQHNNSISYQQLIDLENNKSKPTNWTPWILGGMGIVVVIIGLVWLVKRNNKEK